LLLTRQLAEFFLKTGFFVDYSLTTFQNSCNNFLALPTNQGGLAHFQPGRMLCFAMVLPFAGAGAGAVIPGCVFEQWSSTQPTLVSPRLPLPTSAVSLRRQHP
jgi:hypothetical protein